MTKKTVFCLLFLLSSAVCASADETREITLVDGSVIRAQVISLSNGVYTLRSESMGTFSLNASTVRLIGAAQGASDNVQSGAQFKEKVEKAKTAIMSDPEGRAAVAALAEDPAIKELMSDPEVMAALKVGDTATLLRNPRFRALMEDPKMQETLIKLMKRTQSPQ